jgi:hypothetical protein
MKSTFTLIAAAFLLSLASTGCYTQLATREPSGDGEDDQQQQYTSSDTTGAGAESPFFVYDDYRYMRYNMTFSYYHPRRWSYDVGMYDGGIYDPWYGGLYEPWYGDSWYWPYGWRPYVLYPYPTWNAYGYYGNHHGGSYGGGWNHGGFADGNGRAPMRTRTTGATRGNTQGGMVSPNGSPTAGSSAPSIRTRDNAGQQPVTTRQAETPRTTTTRSRGNETPWWERSQQQSANASQTQAVTTQSTPRAQSHQPAGNAERRNRTMNQSPNSTGRTGNSGSSGSSSGQRRERTSSGQGRTTQVAPSSQGRGSAPASSGGGGQRSGGSSGGSSSGGSRGRER